MRGDPREIDATRRRTVSHSRAGHGSPSPASRLVPLSLGDLGAHVLRQRDICGGGGGGPVQGGRLAGTRVGLAHDRVPDSYTRLRIDDTLPRHLSPLSRRTTNRDYSSAPAPAPAPATAFRSRLLQIPARSSPHSDRPVAWLAFRNYARVCLRECERYVLSPDVDNLFRSKFNGIK